MLEKLDLDLAVPKDEYKARLPKLQQRLFELQTLCWKNNVASMLVFEGWDGAGKGSCINALTERLEPRGFRLHAVQAPRTYQTRMPWLWRFWCDIPAYGQIAIFDRSWYRRVFDDRVEKTARKAEWRRAYQEINEFERAMADDGCIVLKFFFHVARKDLRRRYRKVKNDPMRRWRLHEWNRRELKLYDEYLQAAEEMLARTGTEWAPWVIVEAADRYWARIKVFETAASAWEAALRKRGIALRAAGGQ